MYPVAENDSRKTVNAILDRYKRNIKICLFKARQFLIMFVMYPEKLYITTDTTGRV
jgi:hypothetical protein